MSFFLLYIFIILVFWRPQEWLIPWMFGIPVLQGVTYAAVLSLMLEFDSGAIKFNRREPQYFLYLWLFIAALMSHIANTYFAGLLLHWASMFRLCFFGILLFACCTTVSRLRWIVRAFVVMALLMAVHAILMDSRGYGFAGQLPIMSWRPKVEGLVPRTLFFGIFEDPNDLGQFLATSMPFCFMLAKRGNFLSYAAGSVAAWYLFQGMLTTLSRGAQMGLAVSAGVALIMLIFRRSYRFVLLLGLLGSLSAIPFSGRLMGDAWERVDLWGEANWAFKAKPLFGVGLGMINEYTTQSKSVHNAYVSCYAEIGIFGFFFWFSLLFLSVLGLLQARRALRGCEDPEGQWLYRFSAWGLAALAGFAASAYFLSRAFVFPFFFLFSMMGVVPVLARQYVPDRPDDMRLGLTIRDTAILCIPQSAFAVVYVYISILLLNMMRYT